MTKIKNSQTDWKWSVKIEDANGSQCSAIVFDDKKYIYATGSYNSTALFYDRDGTSRISLTNTSDVSNIFVAKMDRHGDWLWAISTNGMGPQNTQAIIYNNGNVYIVGYFYNNITFYDVDGKSNVSLTNSTEVEDILVAKVNCNGFWQWAIKAEGDVGQKADDLAIDSKGFIYTCGFFNDYYKLL